MQWREFKQKSFNAIYKAYWYPQLYLPNCVPILVYTPPKTGTTTLRNTLYRQWVGPVFWAHGSLNPEAVKRYRKRLAERGVKPVTNHFWQHQVYHRYIEANRPIKIISSIRDVVDADISRFFQRFQHYYQQDASAFTDKTDDLQQLFYKDYIDTDDSRQPWFADKYGVTLGINIYDYPFPHDKGYMTLHHQHMDILILRVETPDAVKAHALGEFLGIDNVQIYRANVGAEKSYSETYRRFREQLTLPQAYIDRHYNSPDMRHFYTPEEIASFRARWTIEG